MDLFGQKGVSAVSDGVNAPFTNSQARSGRILDLHGKYYEQSYRGNTYTGTLPAVTLNTVGTSTNNVLANPLGNNVNLSLVRVEMSFTSEQNAVFDYGLYINKTTTAMPVTGTPAAQQSNLVGTGFAPSGQILTSATLPSTPTLYRNIGSQFSAPTASAYVIPESGMVYTHVNASDLYNGTYKVGGAWSKAGSLVLNAGTSTSPPSISGFGVGAYLTQSASPILSITPPFTVAIVLRGTNTSSTAQSLITTATASQAAIAWGLQSYEPSKTQAAYFVTNANPTYATAAVAACTLSATNAGVIMAGFDASNDDWVQYNTSTTGESTSGWTAPGAGTFVTIGNGRTLGSFPASTEYICEIMINNAIPSSTNFTALYNAILPNLSGSGSSTGAAPYWPCLSVDLDGTCILTPGTSVSVMQNTGTGAVANITYVWEEVPL